MRPHDKLAPSAWVKRWMGLVAPGSMVLDVACGFGRHTRLATSLGHRVVAVDRNQEALSGLESLPGVSTVAADIESSGWPLPERSFDAVIVANYLHRPLFPVLLDAVCASGLLIYETFARGNERFGRPSNPDFLLDAGELLDRVRPAMRVLGYEDLYSDDPKPAMVQRICAAGENFSWPQTTG